MRVNINIIVGGVDNIPTYILDIARVVRKEMKETFGKIEIEVLQDIDICLCFSGNVSRYYSESGIYQSRYYFKNKRFTVYVHFASNEWSLNKKENIEKFLKMYNDYLLELLDIIGKKITDNKLKFENKYYRDVIKKIFENIIISDD